MRGWIVAFGALVASAACAGEPPPGFARLSDIAPGVTQEMRYAGRDNFTGAPVPGYRAPQCWLRAEAAKALGEAQTEAHARGFSLVVYDCYRPKRAVAAFVDWSKSADESTKAAYYPRVDKRQLFAQGYIAARSTHSTGLAVDLGVIGWDFGTPFDFFDRRSWTKATAPTDQAPFGRKRPNAGKVIDDRSSERASREKPVPTFSQRALEASNHRAALVALMRRHGFTNYPREWWHFTYKAAGKAESYDVEVE